MESRTLATLVAAGFLVILLRFQRRNKTPLPPGPPADPLIGHLRIIPQENQPDVFHEWAKIYGDVMYLEVPGRKMIILDSFEVARELLEERGANYSSRPWFVVWELMGWTPSIAFLPYGKEFLKHRKMIQTFFGKKECLAFNHALSEEAQLLVKNLHGHVRGDLLKFVHRLTVSNIVRVTYGHQVKSDEDPFMRFADIMTETTVNSGPIGSTPVDLCPWLRHFPSWFPGTYYATMARTQWHTTIRKVYDLSVEFVQAGMKDKTITRSFVSEKLERFGEHEDQETLTLDDIKGAAASVFSAGHETSYQTLVGFMLVMILNPKIQQRAYEEITTVVGQDRFPDLSDRDSLPYLECILQEIFRWHTTAPLGIPHYTLEDDTYNGMFIPKGTVVISNIRGMSRDERHYSDPLKFNPSRFLPAPEGNSEPRFSVAMWGFGRRICPGRYFAELAIWHVLACVLSTLEILPLKDESGNVVIPEMTTTGGFSSAFSPFEFEVRPRSEKARALIAQIE